MEARTAIRAAKETYGERIVRAALHHYNDPMGAIGGHMIRRGYLTMDHVTELLNGDHAREIDRKMKPIQVRSGDVPRGPTVDDPCCRRAGSAFTLEVDGKGELGRGRLVFRFMEIR
jgi:hypothetical protein